MLANLLLFANFVTIKYLLYCGSRRNRLAGTEPIPVRFSNTGWGTLRRPFALVSIKNVVIVTESCEMTVGHICAGLGAMGSVVGEPREVTRGTFAILASCG